MSGAFQLPEVPQAGKGSSDGGFTFRIARVQEWTLGAVVIAAVSFGIWMGTLNTKLEHIESFVDTANDSSNGIYIRLTRIQTTLDLLDKSKTAASEAQPNDPGNPRIVHRSIPSDQTPDSVFKKLVEYKLVMEILDSEAKAHNAGTPPTAFGPPSPSDPELSRQQSLWLAEVKSTALGQLQQIETDVNEDKAMPFDTRNGLLNLIMLQRQRVNLLQP